MRAPHGLGRSGLVLTLIAATACACAASVESPGSPAAPAAAPSGTGRLQQENPPANIGVVERYAWQAVLQLGEAYAKGDVEGFLARVSRGFYRGYPALESALRAQMADSSSRSAVVAVREVALEGDRVAVRAQWERTLARRGQAPQLLAGETVFYFLRSETSLRLLDFRGDVPFGIEGIPAAP